MRNRPRILLVEDEEESRGILKTILEEEENYHVVGVGQGFKAIEEAKKNSFNIAIIDLKLPDIGGLEVLHKIKEISPDIHAFIVTAYPSIDTSVAAIEKEAYDYIIKPFDVTQLKLVIRRGLEKQKLVGENRRLLEDLQIAKSKLEEILEIGKLMSAILNLDDLLNFIVDKVTELLGAEKGSLMVIDKNSGELVIRGAKGLDDEIVKTTRIKLGKAIAGLVAQQGEPLLVRDIDKELNLKRENGSKYKSKSFLCMPLKVKDETIGVINVADKVADSTDNIFTDEDLRVLSGIIHHAAIAIENAKLYEKANVLAHTDAVTRIFNHRYFQQCLTEEINRAKRYPRPLSLIMLDIDNFKDFNDEHGHLKGDKALKEIAQILKTNTRKIDIVSRYGGEEFTIIMPETEAKGAEIVAEKIRKSVEKHKFKPPSKLTITAGIAIYEQGMSKNEFIKTADQALYQAKSEGKNKVRVSQ